MPTSQVHFGVFQRVRAVANILAFVGLIAFSAPSCADIEATGGVSPCFGGYGCFGTYSAMVETLVVGTNQPGSIIVDPGFLWPNLAWIGFEFPGTILVRNYDIFEEAIFQTGSAVNPTQLVVGHHADGELRLEQWATANVFGALFLGTNPGVSGKVQLTGKHPRLTTGDQYIGYLGGHGTLEITGGEVRGERAIVGSQGGTASISISHDSDSLSAVKWVLDRLTVHSGNIDVANRGQILSGPITIDASASSATVRSGGLIRAALGSNIFNDGNQITITGANSTWTTVCCSDDLLISEGSFRMSGAEVILSDGGLLEAGDLLLSGGTLSADGPETAIILKGSAPTQIIDGSNSSRPLLSVTGGAKVRVEKSDGVASTLIGGFPGSYGEVFISGNDSEWDAGDSLAIGVEYIEGIGSGVGLIGIEDGGALRAGEIVLGETGEIRGVDATIIGNVDNGGIISPGIAFETESPTPLPAIAAANAATVIHAANGSPAPTVLTIVGDLDVSGLGRLYIDVDTVSSEQIVVRPNSDTGALGTIRFSLRDFVQTPINSVAGLVIRSNGARISEVLNGPTTLIEAQIQREDIFPMALALSIEDTTASQSVTVRFQDDGTPRLVMTKDLYRPTRDMLNSFVVKNGMLDVSLDFDPELPTIVVAHGWQPVETALDAFPMESLASAILGRLTIPGGMDSVNVVTYTWQNAADWNLGRAGFATTFAGQDLALQLLTKMGRNYNEPVHFIGHSLGTLVVTAAAELITGQSAVDTVQFDFLDIPHEIHMPTEDGADRRDVLDGSVAGTIESRLEGLSLFDSEIIINNYIADGARQEGITPFGTGVSLGNARISGVRNIPVADSNHGHIWDTYYADIVRNNFDSIALGGRGPLIQVQQRDFLNLPILLDEFSADGNASGSGSSLLLIEQSPASIFGNVFVPADAEYLTFDFFFENGGDGDYVSLMFNDLLLWVFLGLGAEQLDTMGATVPVAKFANTSGELKFVLNSVGESNAIFHANNIAFSTPVPIPPANLLFVSALVSCNMSRRFRQRAKNKLP